MAIDYTLPTHAPTGPGRYRLRCGMEVEVVARGSGSAYCWKSSTPGFSASWDKYGYEQSPGTPKSYDIIAPVSSAPVAVRGAHVRIHPIKGGGELVWPTHGLILASLDGSCVVRSIAWKDVELQTEITPQEYQRLAALLTGEALREGE